MIRLVCIVCLCLFACGRMDVDRDGNIKLRGEKPVSLENKRVGDLIQKGTASWYGDPYHGRKTANGETYNMYDLTAAHKTLGFNTRVKVVNRNNGRSVIVRINDRGPFIRGRIIDLSRKAAAEINMIGTGTAPVDLYLADSGKPVARDEQRNAPATRDRDGFWTVQAGSFSERQRARDMEDRLETFGRRVNIYRADGMYRVRVGRFETKAEAARFAERLAREAIDSWVVFQEDE